MEGFLFLMIIEPPFSPDFARLDFTLSNKAKLRRPRLCDLNDLRYATNDIIQKFENHGMKIYFKIKSFKT